MLAAEPKVWLEVLAGLVEGQEQRLLWLGGLSVGLLVASLVAIPIVIGRLPADYFAHGRRESFWLQRLTPIARVSIIVLKNAIGLALVACGILMLVLPGQGILAILIGISLLDFPGKYRLERWLLGRRTVFRSLNWLRRRLSKPEFQPPSASTRGGGAPSA